MNIYHRQFARKALRDFLDERRNVKIDKEDPEKIQTRIELAKKIASEINPNNECFEFVNSIFEGLSLSESLSLHVANCQTCQAVNERFNELR